MMLIILSRLTSIYQSIAEVQLTGVAPSGDVNQIFKMFNTSTYFDKRNCNHSASYRDNMVTIVCTIYSHDFFIHVPAMVIISYFQDNMCFRYVIGESVWEGKRTLEVHTLFPSAELNLSSPALSQNVKVALPYVAEVVREYLKLVEFRTTWSFQYEPSAGEIVSSSSGTRS